MNVRVFVAELAFDDGDCAPRIRQTSANTFLMKLLAAGVGVIERSIAWASSESGSLGNVSGFSPLIVSLYWASSVSLKMM